MLVRSLLLEGTFIRHQHWEIGLLSNFQNYVVILLRHTGGANAVEYSLMMVLVAVFIIAGILAMSGAMGGIFNQIGSCLDDPATCTPAKFCNVAQQNCGNNN